MNEDERRETAALVAEAYQRGYDDGCDDPESVWTSTREAFRVEGATGVRARVEAVLAEGPDTWTPYDSRDTGETFLADLVLDFTAAIRAALDDTGDGEATP